MAFNRRTLLKTSLLASNSLCLSNTINLNNEEHESESENENENVSDNETNLARSKDSIYLTGPITEESCWGVTQALINYQKQLLHHDNIYNNINLYIQSPGGSLLPTLALVDEIKLLNIPVHTYIRGYAASAATLLSVVGSKRYMYNHSLMMIHGVRMYGQSAETLSDIKDMNSNVNLFIQTMKNIYLENSNITEEKLEEFFYRDKWISANEALSYGLIDEII